MNPFEPRIAIAASPREWAQRLHRHVADHGGAIVRATVLHPKDALGEDVDVFIVDDTTSFLSSRLVDELHRRGRAVLGVFDPEDPHGKGELVDCGADDVIERSASPQAFVAAIAALASQGATEAAARPDDADAVPPRRTPALRRGQVTVVAGVAGGVGATEIAIGLAAASGGRGDSTVLVDADDTAPALAQRLGVGLYPNVRAAVDAMDRREGTLADVLVPVGDSRFAALPGLASARNWLDLRPVEVSDLLRALTSVRRHVVCNVGHRIEELPGSAGQPPRYGLARGLLATADVVVAVCAATPVGLARLLEWLADASALLGGRPLHVVVNRAPADRFRRGEITDELRRALTPAGLWFVPEDPRVADAAWRGSLATQGPFTKAVAPVCEAALPTQSRIARRRQRRG